MRVEQDQEAGLLGIIQQVNPAGNQAEGWAARTGQAGRQAGRETAADEGMHASEGCRLPARRDKWLGRRHMRVKARGRDSKGDGDFEREGDVDPDNVQTELIVRVKVRAGILTREIA